MNLNYTCEKHNILKPDPCLVCDLAIEIIEYCNAIYDLLQLKSQYIVDYNSATLFYERLVRVNEAKDKVRRLYEELPEELLADVLEEAEISEEVLKGIIGY